MSSLRIESVKPTMACLAPQYADWSGIERYASAEPIWTIVPWLRGRMRLRAAMVPYTNPR